MRKFIVFIILVFYFLPHGGLFCLPPQKTLHPGDWAYDALDTLSKEQGRVFFADTRVTVAQMEAFLTEIDVNSLSGNALAIYDRLEAYLKSESWVGFRSDALSGWLDLTIEPELYFKTNENVPWNYDGHERSAILQMPIGFSLGPWITAEMDLYLGQNEYAATLHDNYINIPLDPVQQFDIHFPKRAYVNAGSPLGKASGFNFAIGIGDNFFGRTQTGSIVISEYLERAVYAQASVYSPAIKYTAQMLQYEVNKYHYIHYLQVRPHKMLSVSLAEGVMVNAPLELRFLNPFTIFHSYESFRTYKDYNRDLGHQISDAELDELWDKNPDGSDKYDRTYDPINQSRIGSYFGVKVEFQPLQNFRFYGLFVMDQFNLPMKKDNWMSTLYPDAAGFQAGIEYSFPSQGGYWEFGIEGVYTYPYLYVMWDKGWSFVKENTILYGPTIRSWTGTPFGPDTIAGSLRAGFHSNEQWYGGFTFEVSAQGERSSTDIFDRDNSIDDTYRPSHYVYGVTVPPTGIPVFTCTASFRFEYSPKKWMDIVFMPGYRVLYNAGHEEGRTEQGLELALSLCIRPKGNHLVTF